MTGPRGARRGRRPAGADTRGRILEAARGEFADRGYDAASLRGIARTAGVDPALVHHYFEGKADLFAEAVVLARVHPGRVVDGVLDGPVDALGERLVRAFLGVWDEPEHRERFVALARAAMTNEQVGTLVRQFVSAEIVGRVTAHTGVADPQLRGALAAAQIFGLGTMRYVLRLPPLVDASHDEVVAWLGPTLQRFLVD